ncbi:GNAT family N-acetyltransferase [Dactylosporangium sp. NPDC048998]|uniref:GNAT family N-acetyltransferase n=1 Tax=Dactylosporangium sp. NPDC048998 TaxID=3363976 RepID=UPI003713F209
MLAVRPAVSADLPALINAFGERFYFEDRLARRPQQGVLFAAFLDNVAVGAAFLRLMPAEEWELRERLRGVPILSHLQVRENVRRQGVASAIMNTAEEYAWMRGRMRMALGVTPQNTAARRLYLDRGYVEWDFGLVNAMVVDYDETGRKQFSIERCQILVKALRAPARV